MITLGIESSCDDSSVALLKDGNEVLSMVKKSQVELHEKFGGVVPEVAARGHTEAIFPVLKQCFQEANLSLDDVDLIAATAGPGLIGSLLVGLTLGKGLSLASSKPFLPVHHLEAHFAANFLEYPEIEFPMVGLLVSGGHSCLYSMPEPGVYHLLGQTRDDAVGELYDKVARKMGLPQPGGPAIDQINASVGEEFEMTPPMLHTKDLDFSFSGLKTACLNALEAGQTVEAIARGMQSAVIKVLWKKSLKAMKETSCKTLLLAGGVSANRGIRETFERESQKRGYKLFVPRIALCTDNGAMVARAAYDRYRAGYRSDLKVDAFSRMPLQELEVLFTPDQI